MAYRPGILYDDDDAGFAVDVTSDADERQD